MSPNKIDNQTFWLPSTILSPKKCTKRMRVFDPNIYAVGLSVLMVRREISAPNHSDTSEQFM